MLSAIFFFQKTKPTQHSVRELRALGLTPHLLASRSAEVYHCTSWCLYAFKVNCVTMVAPKSLGYSTV